MIALIIKLNYSNKDSMFLSKSNHPFRPLHILLQNHKSNTATLGVSYRIPTIRS